MSIELDTVMLFVRGLEDRAEERHARANERWDAQEDHMRTLTAEVAKIGTDVAVLKAFREADAAARDDRDRDEQTTHRRIGTVLALIGAVAAVIAWLWSHAKTAASSLGFYLGYHR